MLFKQFVRVLSTFCYTNLQKPKTEMIWWQFSVPPNSDFAWHYPWGGGHTLEHNKFSWTKQTIVYLEEKQLRKAQ
jgi:hypothetical protein